MNDDPKVRRTLHFRFSMPNTDPEQIAAMAQAGAQFYRMFGNVRVRLLHNADDPAKYVQEIEYDAPEEIEVNRQKMASDPSVQAYLQVWRQMFPGAVEVDVYREIWNSEAR
jgi:hypothetical protein